MADVSIITLSRTPDHFSRLLAALEYLDPTEQVDANALLVNNASNADMAHDALSSGWLSVDYGRNTSYAEGHNLAVDALRGAGLLSPWLLLLNDDVDDVRPDFLACLVQAAEEQQLGVCGSILLEEYGEIVNHAGTAVWPDCATDHIGRGDVLERWYKQGRVALTPAVTFAAVLVRTTLWDELCGLSESYFYGWEDTDFCLRALEHGAKVGVARDAVATHGECGTRPRGSSRDAQNFKVFRDSWLGRLGPLLDTLPSHVEGLEWRNERSR